jgi:hypothetical protein
MKKLIFTGLAIAFGYSSIAQKLALPAEPNVKASNKAVRNQTKSFSKDNISEWFSVEEMVNASDLGTNSSSGISFMYPDSNAKSIFASGQTSYATWQSIGHVLDPKDDVILFTPNPDKKLTKYVSYKLDSISFPYSYLRYNDSVDDGQGGKLKVVDTLFVFYYLGSQIQRNSFTGSGDKIPLIGYNTSGKQTAANYFKSDTILLTDADSTVVENIDGFETSFGVKRYTIAAPSGMAINANKGLNQNNLIGATFVYKPMLPTIRGVDTAVMLLQQNPIDYPNVYRANYWGYSSITANEGADWVNPTYYNSSQFAVIWQSYGQNANWANLYVPGGGFVRARYMEMDFLVTTTSGNVGIKDINNDEFAMTSVYPNPAQVGGTAVLGFNLLNAGTVRIAVYNIAGQLVKHAINAKYTVGAHEESIDLTGLKAGIYMVNMTINGASITKKLTITE